MIGSLVVAVILVVIGGLVWRALTTGSIEAPKKPERRKSSVSAALLQGDKPPSFYAAPESTKQVLEQVRKLSRATEEQVSHPVTTEPCEASEPSKAAQEDVVPEVQEQVQLQEPVQDPPTESVVTEQESSEKSDDNVMETTASADTPLKPQVPEDAEEASVPVATTAKLHVQFREPEVGQDSEDEDEEEEEDEQEPEYPKPEVKSEAEPKPTPISPTSEVPQDQKPEPLQTEAPAEEDSSEEEESEEDLDEYSTGHNVTKILTADTSRKLHLSSNQIAKTNLLNQELMAAMAKRRSQAPPEE